MERERSNVDPPEFAKAVVISDQRRGLRMVDIQPIGDRSGLVILALIELAAANRANLFIRELGNMECALALAADAPAGKAGKQPSEVFRNSKRRRVFP